jgi:PAS domain S-box-containing protein
LHRMVTNLERYEHCHKLLEKHIREAVVVADLSLTITYCSPSIESLCGKTPTDLVGMGLHSLFSLTSLNAVRVVAERFPGYAKEKLLTLELCRSDGVFSPVSARLFVKPNRDPEIVMVLRDEHALHDKILYATIEKYRLVFETSREAMLVVNIYGRIIDVNSAWVEAFLYPRDEVTGLKLKLFFPKELEDLLVYNVQKPLVSWEGILTTKDGGRLSCRVQAALWRGKDGEVLGHIVRIWRAAH